MDDLIESLRQEFREEVQTTRRMLDRVPSDKLGWKPHDKSRTLGELALHLANLPGMAEKIILHDEFSPGAGPATVVSDIAQFREAVERSTAVGEDAMSRLTPDMAAGEWRFVFRGKEIFRKKRSSALRTNMLNHLYHHRGQLSVYLRLLEVPVPVVYGPTADENPFL